MFSKLVLVFLLSASIGVINGNLSYNSNDSLDCIYCDNEPPPNDILLIPPPPLHPFFTLSTDHFKTREECNFCDTFNHEAFAGEQGSDSDQRLLLLLIAGSLSGGGLFLYFIGKKTNILSSITKNHSNDNICPHMPINKNNSINQSLTSAAGAHLADQCYLQRDKNLISPMISDHVSHKKTSIPSKYWSQPGSIISRTTRRIPNEYEVPSSKTNSTGTSSAMYTDMINNETYSVNKNVHPRNTFVSPYNMHTYAEVRELVDNSEHFHTSSNSSAMMSESNYDNAAIYSHGNCLIGSVMNGAPNGSVQMSDFNSMRPIQSMTHCSPLNLQNNDHHNHSHNNLNHAKIMHFQDGNSQQTTVYEHPSQRQMIITTDNRGINPTLLNHKERVHHVI